MSWKTLTFTAVSFSVMAGSCFAEPMQQGALKRTTLQSFDFPPGYETVTVIAEIAPGNCSGQHTHPGIETAYVLEGELIVKFEGKPDAVFKAGQPVMFPLEVVHDDCNFGGAPFKALATYVVEKGKPLASPVR